MKKLNIEIIAKAIEQDAGMPLPDFQQELEAAKAHVEADDGALTKAQLNQLKKSLPKVKDGKVLSSLI